MAGAPDASVEPPLDRSRDHLLEAHALERALLLAEDAGVRARVQGLVAERETLMAARAAFNDEATRRRHARGEIYSAARIAALNALVPSRDELAAQAQTLYGRQASAQEVLKTHARVHFVHVLMGARLNLVNFPADIRDAARAMQRQEEAFANAVLDAIDDAEFKAEIRAAQRQSLLLLRTSTRAMYLATEPPGAGLEEDDAATLGRAWQKLDDLAVTLGVEPLSTFVAVPGEDRAAALPAARVLTSVAALRAALDQPQHKLSAKKATRASLARLQALLEAQASRDGGAWFEVDL